MDNDYSSSDWTISVKQVIIALFSSIILKYMINFNLGS